MGELKEILKNTRKHLMNGVSYMLPVVVSGGVLLAVALMIHGEGGVPETGFTADIFKMGATGLGLMVPVLSAYIAMSIADRSGIAPGLIGGMIAVDIGAGFLGGIISGLVAGISAQYLKKVPLPSVIRSIGPIIVIPIISTFITSAVLMWGVGAYVAAIMAFAKDFLTSMSGSNKIILGLIVGAMISFDLGGPVNKVAFSLMVATIGEGIYTYAGPCAVAIMTPPMAIAIATTIAPKKYTEEERSAGKSAFFMSLVGVSEGAIPFAANDPVRVIPCLMVGTSIGTAIAYALDVTTKAAWGGFIVLPVSTNIPGFIASAMIGAAIGALLLNFFRKPIEEAPAESLDDDDVDISFE